MNSATALLERPTRSNLTKPAAATRLTSPGRSDMRPFAETLLRDMGFVFHLTRKVKKNILAAECPVAAVIR